MNPFIFKRLQPAYQALYESSKKSRLPNELIQALRNQIEYHNSRIYRGRAGMGTDRLSHKLSQQGNNGGYMWQLMQSRCPQFYEDKGVANEFLGEWISVEIECVLPNPGVEVALLTFLKKNNLTRYITVKHDGSIRTFHDCVCPPARDPDRARACTCEARQVLGREIVISFRYGHWDFLTLVCGKLNNMGVKVNVSCGLHVHFDCRHIDSRKVSLIGRRVARCIPALKTILPKSRLNNAFCQADINSHRAGRRENREARYAFVNLMAYGRHKTLEIRGHSGTTDAKKIINWIRMLRKIMDTRNTKIIADPVEMATKFKFEDDLAAYVKERFEKFSKAPARHPLAADDVLEDNLNASKDFPCNFEAIRSELGIREPSRPLQNGMNFEVRMTARRAPSGLRPISVSVDPAPPAPAPAPTPVIIDYDDAVVVPHGDVTRSTMEAAAEDMRQYVARYFMTPTRERVTEPAPVPATPSPMPEPVEVAPAPAMRVETTRTIEVDLETGPVSEINTQDVVARLRSMLGVPADVTHSTSSEPEYEDFDYEPEWDS